MVPKWVKDEGPILLMASFAILMTMISNVGQDTGWFLFILVLISCVAAWRIDYKRRLGNARRALRLKLYAQSCLEAVDAMGGHEFEDYYAWLLASLGWTDIVVVGRKSGGDGGADILATDPHGRRFAIQCKRYTLTNRVDIEAVRRLNGALAHEHPGRRGMIVTTSRLTAPAERLAGKSGVEVVDRPALASQMARVRYEAERKNARMPTATPSPELT